MTILSQKTPTFPGSENNNNNNNNNNALKGATPRKAGPKKKKTTIKLGQFCYLSIKLLSLCFFFILERQVLGGFGWKMPRPTKKFSPSLLTKERKVIRYFQIIINTTIISPKQHLSPFSFIFSLQSFSSTLFHLQTNIPLKAIVNNPFKEIFMGKEEKVINILTIFSIFHKSGIKFFLK